MSTLQKSLLLIMSAIILLAPVMAYAMEKEKDAVPIIEMLQSGKAVISSDKKSIVDEKGDVIAKETVNTIEKKPVVVNPDPIIAAREALVSKPKVIFCNRKCGLIEKRCYIDDAGNTVCINTCEKEVLICD